MLDVKFGILKSSAAEYLIPPKKSPPAPPIRLNNFERLSGSSSPKVKLPGSEVPLWYRTGPVPVNEFEFLIASNRVSSITGKESTLRLGERLPIVRFDPRNARYSVAHVDIGFKLELLGNIIPAEPKVLLQIKIETLQLGEILNDRYPMVSSEVNKRCVLVENGEEILITGFPAPSRTVTRENPLLHDLPNLGPLFQNPEISNRLVLIIKPSIFQ